MTRWIIQRDGVLGGRPYVRGTRLTVQQLRQEIASGKSPTDVLAAHPELTEEALEAVRLYNAQVVRRGILRPGSSRDEFSPGGDRGPGAIGEDSFFGRG
jgi:uncharacterized protein (DUF433 family)